MHRDWLIRVVVVVAVTAIAVAAVAATGWPLAIFATASGSAAPSSSATPAPTLATASATASPSASAAPSPTPSATPSPTPIPPLAEGVVPVLYMHRAEAVPPEFATWTATAQADFLRYDVLPTALAADLDWLVANGYTTILPRDLAAHWDEGKALPPRPVILSFDDGDVSWTRTILPLLQARGMVAEFYLTLTTIKEGAVTWAEVQLLADAGMGIGAHDVDHFQLAALGAGHPPYPSSTMWYQVHEARVIIGQHLGTPPDSMAYVGGGFDATLVALVKQAGYTTARSIIRSIQQDVAHRFLLRVVRVGGTDDVADALTGAMVPGLPVFSAKMAGTRT